MDNGRFGGIIDSLALGNVDDMSGYARRRNKASARKALQLFSIRCSTLELLSAKMLASSMGAVHNAVRVNLHQVVVSRQICINECLIAPCHAGIGDKDVQTAAQVSNSLRYTFFNGCVRCDIYFVCLACDGVLVRLAILIFWHHPHWTLYLAAMSAAVETASALELYQIATLAPASANALATARPIPPPAPEMMAVLPVREKRDMAVRSGGGGSVLLRQKVPFRMVSIMVEI